jgi:hypothetical protein
MRRLAVEGRKLPLPLSLLGGPAQCQLHAGAAAGRQTCRSRAEERVAGWMEVLRRQSSHSTKRIARAYHVARV